MNHMCGALKRSVFELFDRRNVGDCSNFLWVVIRSPSTFIVAQVLSAPPPQLFKVRPLLRNNCCSMAHWVHDSHSLKLTYHKVCNKLHPTSRGFLGRVASTSSNFHVGLFASQSFKIRPLLRNNCCSMAHGYMILIL
jgi:hypothetical protein